jgi:predicted acetyltransferase
MQVMLRAYQECLADYSSSIDVERKLSGDWFERPGRLFPFVILSDERPVGILLVMGRAYAEASGLDVDYMFNDLYIEPEFRGTGTTERAVVDVLGRFHGSWGLEVIEANLPALRFWQRVLGKHTSSYEERASEPGFVQLRFTTSAASRS